MTPRVSIVLPTFQRPELLARAIDTVMAQSIEDWELIVVDDNDPMHPDRNATVDTMAAYAGDRRISLVKHESNRGGSAARNSGIGLARAPWIAFLDDDDEWHPEKLERQLTVAEAADTDVALVYCMIRVRRAVSTRVRSFTTPLQEGHVRGLLRRNFIGSTSCVVCRASALHAIGLFDEHLTARQDVDLYVRLAKRYGFTAVEEPLVTMHLHGAARVSTDLEARVQGHRRFLRKHRRLLETEPRALQMRLNEFGRLLLASGKLREARTALGRAWRLEVRDIPALRALLMTYPSVRRLHEALNRRRPARGRTHAERRRWERSRL